MSQTISASTERGEHVYLSISDLDDFILSPPDADVFVCDEEGNQWSCPKGSLCGFQFGD